jgi:nitrogen regulatory protein PII
VKAVLIVHNAAIDAEVSDLLKSVGIGCYTKFADVLGRGQLSEPHLNTEVWPGVNSATLVVVEEDKARAAMDGVRRMRQTYGSEGVKAFLWEIQDIT